MGRDVLGASAGQRAHDAVLGQRDEDRLAGPAGELGGLALDGVEIRRPESPVIRASSAAFILKPSGGKSCRPRRLSARTIRPGLSPQRRVGRLSHRARDDARFRAGRPGPAGAARRPGSASSMTRSASSRWRSSGVGVQFLESSRFSSRGGLAGLDHQRLAVDRRASRGRGEEMLEDHAGPGRQGPAQLVALAVVAAEADGVDLADPQRDQVVEDRAGRARLAADLDDVVDRQAGLDRGLVLRGVDVQVAVEEEVAHDRDAQPG